MKPKNIQRSASFQRHRNPGDAPGIGRVKRMPGTGMPRVIRKRRRSEGKPDHVRDKRQIRQLQARRFAILMWLAIVLVATFATLAGGFVVWKISQGDRRSLAPQFVLPVEESYAVQRLTDFPPPDESAAIQFARAAVDAREPAAVAARFRPTNEADVNTMADFLATMQSTDGTIIGYEWIGPLDTDRLQIQAVLVKTRREERMLNRLVLLVPDDQGDWRVDFPAFARLCDPPIQLMDTPDGYPGGRVRVFIASDTYYNGPFRDDQEWACFGIASPDCDQIGFAYAPRNSPQHLAMQAMLRAGERFTSATLDLHRLEGAEKRQFQIHRVLAEGWVATDEPFDARFE
jgi:hypothetical protein